MVLSKNAVGLVVLMMSLFGIEVSEVQIIELISAIGLIISFALMVKNQLGRKDTKGFFFKQ